METSFLYLVVVCFRLIHTSQEACWVSDAKTELVFSLDAGQLHVSWVRRTEKCELENRVAFAANAEPNIGLACDSDCTVFLHRNIEIIIWKLWNPWCCPFCFFTKYTKSKLYFFKITQAYTSVLCKQSHSWASAFFDRATAGTVGHEVGQSVITGLNLTQSQPCSVWTQVIALWRSWALWQKQVNPAPGCLYLHFVLSCMRRQRCRQCH